MAPASCECEGGKKEREEHVEHLTRDVGRRGDVLELKAQTNGRVTEIDEGGIDAEDPKSGGVTEEKGREKDGESVRARSSVLSNQFR